MPSVSLELVGNLRAPLAAEVRLLHANKVHVENVIRLDKSLKPVVGVGVDGQGVPPTPPATLPQETARAWASWRRG
eukprot:9005176-Pyramimonas_sp.AAC.1